MIIREEKTSQNSDNISQALSDDEDEKKPNATADPSARDPIASINSQFTEVERKRIQEAMDALGVKPFSQLVHEQEYQAKEYLIN